MQKVKGNGVTGMQIHNQREKESDTNTDIEKDRSHLNYDLENPSSIDYHEKIKGMIDERVDQSKRKVRKDAVKVASFMITSDKDFFDRIGEKEEKRFFEVARNFIGERYGKDNIAYAMVHKDEKTPHMHLGMVPITEDNRLSAKDFFGKKQQLHQLQDDFHAHMQEHGFDLERGISSDRKHLDTAKFKLQTVQEKVNELESELTEKQQEKGQVEASIEAIQTELKDLTSSVEHSKLVEQVEYKESGLIGPKTVKLASSDFDNIKTLAKVSETLKTQNNAIYVQNKRIEGELNSLNKENRQLKKENRQLKQENKELKQEIKFWKRTIEKCKVLFKDQVQEIGRKVGAVKVGVLEKMGMELYKKFFTDQEEVFGAQSFAGVQKEHREEQKQKRKEKEQEELER